MRSAILLTALVFAATVGGQTFQVWDEKGNDAWVDIRGNPVPRPASEDIGRFSEGLAPIRVGNKTGYVNGKGEIVIEPRWVHEPRWGISVAGPFSEGLAAVSEEVIKASEGEYEYYIFKCGYIDKTGKYVIPPKYRGGCGQFSSGRAWVALDRSSDPDYRPNEGAIGFMDKTGSWAIKPQYFEATGFMNGYALVRTDAWPTDWEAVDRKSLHLVDTEGRPAVGVKDCRWRRTFIEGLALIWRQGQRPEYINEKCDVAFVLPTGIELDVATTFSEGLLPVYKGQGGKKVFGYLDKTGRVAIDFRFSDAGSFSDGLADVRIGDAHARVMSYIDHSGKIVLADVRGGGQFRNGLAMHFLHLWTINDHGDHRNIYGLMNKQGKYVWLAPRAENYLDKQWIKDNYIGPDPRFRQ